VSKLDEIKKKLEEFQAILEKSGYGPKKMGLYNPVDNIERKQTRTSDELADVGPNKAVRQYTTAGSSMQAAHEAAEAKRQKKKSKSTLRTIKDMSPEELGEMNARLNKDDLDEKIKAKMLQEMNRRNFGEAEATRHIIDRDRGDTATKQPKIEPLKHSESEKVKYNKNGQWSLNKDNAPHAPESAEDSAHDVIEEHGDLRRELLDLTDEQKKTMLEHIRKYKEHGNDWLRSQQNRKAGE
jgi:hypothetical protein